MRISTKLEEEFDLAPISMDDDDDIEDDEVEPETPTTLIQTPTTIERYKELDKIEEALPQVFGLNSTDDELDELAKYAIKAHQDLMDLSMNIEQRFAGEVASAAGNMLGHAIAARTNKIKKKLDMINLQIKKQVADHKTKSVDEPEELQGGTVLDRNELLAHLLDKSSQNDKK